VIRRWNTMLAPEARDDYAAGGGEGKGRCDAVDARSWEEQAESLGILDLSVEVHWRVCRFLEWRDCLAVRRCFPDLSIEAVWNHHIVN